MINYEIFRNKLCVFEGADSVGKSSVAKILAEKLSLHGMIESIFTFQPGDTAYGKHAETIRSFCKDKRYGFHELSNLFLFLADRVEVTDKVVRPALEAGKTVISDRWSYSTVAYQLCGKQLADRLPQAVVDWLLGSDINLCPEPDYVFYFPQKILSSRPEDHNDTFETAGGDFFSRVHEAYDIMSGAKNWYRIYPGESAEETVDDILSGRWLIDAK